MAASEVPRAVGNLPKPRSPGAPGSPAGPGRPVTPARTVAAPGGGLRPKGVELAALPPLDFPGRLANLREAMAQAGCDALLVSSLTNVRYLCGFSGSAGLLFVGPGEAVLVTDGRYGTSAEAEVGGQGVKVEALPAAGQLEALAELLASVPAPGHSCRLGLEAEHVSWERLRRWQEGWARQAELVPTTGVVEALRRRKGPGELARLAAAAAVADQAFGRVLPVLRKRVAQGRGMSEAEVALALELEMRRLGAEAPAFASIVASGPGGAEPHHRPSGRLVQAGDLVTLDFGAKVDGYCSDATRTVRASEEAGLARELQKLMTVVAASQDAGLSALRAGVAGQEVDRACREVIEAAGLGEFFVHGTGHGVGLEVHEAPAIAASSQDVLEEGQVVTVEPGVYVPGLGGARVEDTVVVLEGGCEVLTLAPKRA